MRSSKKLFAAINLGCLLLVALNSLGQVRLPQLVSDGMVLQRDTKIKLWGWAAPAENISIKFNNKTYKVTADAAGKWLTLLPPMKAGGPYSMDLSASNHIILNNILIGDVWFCSGQSNMALQMERIKEKYPKDIANANFPQIRNFFISTVSDVSKIHNNLPPGKWLVATPDNVMSFGAVSYFFARQLFLKYHVPIGIINSSVGGTPIQAWISEDGIKNIQPYAKRLAQLQDTAQMDSIIKAVAAGKAIKRPAPKPDKGLTGAVKWFDTSYVAEGWHNFWLPGYWADQGVKGLNGTVWFRKEIQIPAGMAGKAAKLFMGRIIDADDTYINGIQVGKTTYQYPPRRYDVPAGLLKAGKNIIVIRVVNTTGKGGFVPDKLYSLQAGGQSIDLRGDWQFKVGQVYEPSNLTPAVSFSAQNEPTGLYNTMVAQAINYTIKGLVWYQGETNADKPAEYNQLLPALIIDWRKQWQQPNLPFIYAQLPNFMEVQYMPSESKWAELREAQLHTLSIPNTGMAVTIDAGEWNDIHPLNKKTVGERLALAAQQVAYRDKTIVSSGPIYQSSQIENGKIILTFSNTGSGLTAKDGGELQQFAIAGADKHFVWANTKIEGNKVIVWSDDVTQPLYVRYAWADNPEGANLFNKEGLPASPFRTDK